MKKLFTILVALLLTASMFAQAPEKMSYQAVIRNSSEALVTNTNIGMQISILQGSTSGKAVYVETQTPTTNANGLVSIEIGAGTMVSGNFTTIDWANGPYFIKTETDPAGGTSYTITGISQLLSVPYALHAKTAENVTGAITETALGDSTAQVRSEIPDVSGFLTSETDPKFVADSSSIKTSIRTNEQAIAAINSEADGTAAGQMKYWNGTAWITVDAGNEGQVLTLTGGVPTWETKVGDNFVINFTTGKIWMDRNLGASQVATSSTDADAYGDLYQWGRAADGHESRTSGTTATLATSDTPGHGDFITVGSSPYDWRSPQNDNLWQGVGGTNNPCPSGYRLPTEAEWEAERASWSSNNAAGAFASPLKLPVAGIRDFSDGLLGSLGSYSYYWSSTVSGTRARNLFFDSSNASMGSSSRARGYSVRCLKD